MGELIPFASVQQPGDTNDTPPARLAYPPEVRELAFLCWIEASGNSAAAATLLVEECQRDRTGHYPTDLAELPDKRTIQRWAASEAWGDKLIEVVGGNYPATLALYTARLINLGRQALDTIDQLTDPDYVPRRGDMVKADLAKHVTLLLGMGTAGVKGGTPEMPKQDDDDEDLTPQESSRRQLDRIREKQEARKNRKRGA